MTEELNSPEMPLTGFEHHALSEWKRESGDLEGAISSAQDAVETYLNEDNPIKAAEAKSSEFLAWRHLFERSGEEEHKKNAEDAVRESVRIIQESGERKGLGIPLYNLAKFHQTNGEYKEAIDVMKEALEAFANAPADEMGSPSQIAEITTRLSALEYGQGDENAADKFNSALEELGENPHPDEYTQNVWLSGAYMHIAEAFIRREDKEKAKEYLESAEEIIGNDEKYHLRRGQIDKLKEQIRY